MRERKGERGSERERGREREGERENCRCCSKIGTTNRGIGPTYSSKCFRNGVRVADLMGDEAAFEERYGSNTERWNDMLCRYRRLVSYYRNQFPNISIDEEAELAKFKVRPIV